MSSDGDARDIARQLVREVLAAAAPSGDGPAGVAPPLRAGQADPSPAVSNDARAIAHRIVLDALNGQAQPTAASEPSAEGTAPKWPDGDPAAGTSPRAQPPAAQAQPEPEPEPEPAAEPEPEPEPAPAPAPAPAPEPRPVSEPSPSPSLVLPGRRPERAGPSILDRWRSRRRRKRLANQWAPGATPPPRRSWRWLVATVVAAVAIAVLFPLTVAAFRALVAL